MTDSSRPARYLSTPMIKGELRALLAELMPTHPWHKRTPLHELCALAIASFAVETTDPRERRALELAHVLHDNERR